MSCARKLYKYLVVDVEADELCEEAAGEARLDVL